MRGILFDLDGTLLDTLDELYEAVNVSLAEFGYPRRSREEVRSFVGNGVGVLIRKAVPEGTSEADYETCLAFMKEYYAAHSGGATPYPGIMELLYRLKERNIPMAVVTNKPDLPARKLVESRFPGLFDVVIGEVPGRPRKPAPEMPLLVLERLGIGKEDAVYIGDSEVDIQTARNAGLKVVSVTWGFRDEEQLRALGPDWLIRRPEELLDLF